MCLFPTCAYISTSLSMLRFFFFPLHFVATGFFLVNKNINISLLMNVFKSQYLIVNH